jgi:hypothetical protein
MSVLSIIVSVYLCVHSKVVGNGCDVYIPLSCMICVFVSQLSFFVVINWPSQPLVIERTKGNSTNNLCT